LKKSQEKYGPIHNEKIFKYLFVKTIVNNIKNYLIAYTSWEFFLDYLKKSQEKYGPIDNGKIFKYLFIKTIVNNIKNLPKKEPQEAEGEK